MTIGYSLFLRYRKILAVKGVLPKGILLAIGLVGICGVCWAGVWLFNLKKLSAVGRLLSIHITWEHITNHFWWGTGLGRFTWYYPQWQANYFHTNARPSLGYFYCADESYIALNEYLQFFCTLGLFGFLLFGYFLYRFFKLKSTKNASLLLVSKFTVVLILCSGFTSYPFHVNIILLLFGTCLVIGFVVSDEKIPVVTNEISRRINKVLITSCLFLICGIFYRGYSSYNALALWESLRNGGSTPEQAMSTFRKIYPRLNDNGKFLTEYGALLLNDSNQTLTAVKILEGAKERLITRRTIETLVLAYRNAKDYSNAIENQLFLVNYLPNKFLPKYNLLELYVLKKDTSNVKKIGQIILEMPVKKQSYEVDIIKLDTRGILKKYSVANQL